MKKMLLPVCALAFLTLPGAEMKLDFTSSSPWKVMRNHSHRVKFETKEFKGKKATVVTLANEVKTGDTAFCLATGFFNVKDKKSVTVKFSFLAAKGMKDFKGGGYWNNSVRFYDSANKEILPQAHIILPPATGAYQKVTQEFPVPAQAVKAVVHFGFDNPNITKNNIFAVTDVVITY